MKKWNRIVAVGLAIPILVEPTLSNVVTLVASVGLGLAFALKDYGSSLVAGSRPVDIHREVQALAAGVRRVTH